MLVYFFRKSFGYAAIRCLTVLALKSNTLSCEFVSDFFFIRGVPENDLVLL